MKPFVFLLSLFSLAAFAQLPTLPTIPSSPLPPDLYSMAAAEGVSMTLANTLSVTAAVSGTAIQRNYRDSTTTYTLPGGINIGASRVGMGEVFFPSSLVISGPDKYAGGFLTHVTYVTDPLFPNDQYGTINFTAGGTAGVFTMPMSGNFKHRETMVSGTLTSVTKPFISAATSQTITITYSINVSGTMVYGDINHSAPFVIDIWGDSILKGVGPSTEATSIETYFRNYFYNKGYNDRTRNRSVSGSTTTQHVYRAKHGDYRLGRRPALVVIGLGTNNMGTSSGVSAAVTTAVAELKTLVDEALLLTPVTKVLILPPPPRNNATYEANNVLLRSAIETNFASYNSRVSIASALGTAWPSTDATYYITESPQTHPNDKGTEAYFNVGVKPKLDVLFALPGSLPLIPYQ